MHEEVRCYRSWALFCRRLHELWCTARHARANDIRSLRYLPCSSPRRLLMRRSPPFPSLSRRAVIGGCQSGSLRGLRGRWGSRETLSLLQQMGERKTRQDAIRKSPLRRSSRNSIPFIPWLPRSSCISGRWCTETHTRSLTHTQKNQHIGRRIKLLSLNVAREPYTYMIKQKSNFHVHDTLIKVPKKTKKGVIWSTLAARIR